MVKMCLHIVCYLHDQKWHFKGLIPQLQSDYNEHVIHSSVYNKGALYVNIEGHTPTQKNENWSIYQIRKILAERRLVKLDAHTGRVVWVLKNPTGGEDAFENKASFMSPPIPWGGSLYAGATELTGLFNSYVVSVDPNKGKLKWKTLIGSAQQEQNLFGRPVREAVSSSVSVGGGKLYYLTNLGALACLEPTNGNLSWIFLYNRIPIGKPRRALFNTQYRQTGWYNSPVIFANNNIYFAPIDSDRIYCVDAWTGLQKWSRKRGPCRYLLSVVEDKVIIGGDQLVVLDSDTGVKIKEFPMFGEKVTGFGSAAGHLFYFPGELNLYCLDINQLKIVKKVPWKDSNRESGHIIMADSVWVTISKTSFTTFYDFNTLENLLRKKIRNKTKNPLPYLRLANLYSQKKYKRAMLEAIDLYQTALKLATKSNNTNGQFYVSQAQKGLLQLYLKLAKKEERNKQSDEVYKYYNKILTLTNNPKIVIPLLFKQYFYYKKKKIHHKVESCLNKLLTHYGKQTHYFPETGTVVEVAFYAHLLLAEHYENIGRSQDAVKKYQELIVTYPNHIYEGFSGQLLGFIRINKIIDIFGRNVYKYYDEQAKKLYLQANNHSAKLIHILQHYPNSKYIPEISLKLANIFFKQGQIHKTAEHLRQYIRKYPNSANIAQANYLLVKCYEKVQALAAAQSILEQMGKDFPKKTITTISGKKILVANFTKKELEKKQYNKILRRTIPQLEWSKSKAKYHFSKPTKGDFFLRFLSAGGTPTKEFSHLLFLNLSEKIYCYNGSNGKKMWQNSLGWITAVGFVGKYLIAWNSRQIFCLLPETGKIKWQIGTQNRYADVQFGVNAIGVVKYNKIKTLTTIAVIEPETGTERWSNSFFSKQASNLIVGSDVIIAHNTPPALPRIHVYHLNSGRLMHRFLEKSIFNNRKYFYNPVLVNNKFLCVTQKNRWVECYELPTMKRIWRYDGEEVRQDSFLNNEQYVCFQKDNQIVVLDVPNGSIKWTWGNSFWW